MTRAVSDFSGILNAVIPSHVPTSGVPTDGGYVIANPPSTTIVCPVR